MPLAGYLNFRIKQEANEVLERMAKKENRSVGAMIRECIAREGKRQEEQEALLERMKRFEAEEKLCGKN